MSMNEDQIRVSVKKEENCRRVLSVEVEREKYDSERERVVKSFSREVELPGFRKGKVPAEIVSERFPEEIRAETLKTLLPQAYSWAVSSEKLQPIGDPTFKDIEDQEGQPLAFNVELEVAPEVEIEDYTQVDIPLQQVEIEDEEVEQVLKNMQDRFADYSEVERGGVSGDLVEIDYVMMDENGEEIEERRVEDYPVQLGTGQILPDIEEGIVGLEPGITREIEVEYPENYKPEEFAGRKIKYKCKVKKVKEKQLQPLDDEFASKVDSKFSNMNELKEDIRKRLLEEKSSQEERKRREQAVDRLIETNPFDIPRSMVESYKDILKQNARKRGQSVEGEEIEKELDDFSLRSIRRYYIIDYIANREDVEVSDRDIEEEISTLTAERPESEEDMQEIFKKGSEAYKNLKAKIFEDKVFDIILEDKEK
ncbi:MAG: trigger factor [Candidatus Latescibacteria bacterium]|nr:trigger factor [bacterium]MBD3424054.1 trigger factor [Candidatus Latescibacterota bacterium]